MVDTESEFDDIELDSRFDEDYLEKELDSLMRHFFYNGDMSDLKLLDVGSGSCR